MLTRHTLTQGQTKAESLMSLRERSKPITKDREKTEYEKMIVAL